jgi:nitric oxide reductase subunit B
MRNHYARGGGPIAHKFDELPAHEQASIEARVKEEIHANRYDATSGTLTLTAAQARGLLELRSYWEKELGEGDQRYGFLPNTVPTADERKAIADFFFWTAWAAGANRPGEEHTYTNNWPPDRSVGNTASAAALLWSLFSIMALFIGLGIVVYVIHRYRFFYGEEKGVEAAHGLLEMPLTPSQRSAAKYFLVAGLLFVVQILNGGLLAHYTVDPGTFYIEFVGEAIPYSWAKTWHLQLAVFWIAISWVGTAIVLAPMIAGREPKGQRALVNVLFGATFLVVVGSLTGEVLGIKGMLGDLWFWFGHQGWEYLELGRVWQILLFAGLIFWLYILYRPLAAMLRGTTEGNREDRHRRALVAFYVFSAIFVVPTTALGLGKETSHAQ